MIEGHAFSGCELEEITFPVTLKEIVWNSFYECKNLKAIYVENNSEVNVAEASISSSVIVGPPPGTLVRGINVWNLREQKNIVFPEGIERIGNHWFWGASIESVTIPASVREIGADAFCYCKKLKSVAFAEGSRLEKLGAYCFSLSALEKIFIPRGVKELQKGTFKYCINLKEVVFEENSLLKRIGEDTFGVCSSLKHISLPEGLE